jgi:hypothetical protein
MPISIITFFILVYIVIYLYTKNSDTIRSKIFLNYSRFRTAFSLFALFALILIIHVALVYDPHIFSFILNCSLSMAYELQHLFGLILSLIMITFVGLLYKTIK